MSTGKFFFRQLAALSWVMFVACHGGLQAADESLDYEVQVDTVAQHDMNDFLWFHPRAAAIPPASPGANPIVVMTLQKHLRASDHYSGMFVMRTDDLGKTWKGPEERPELGWIKESDDVDVAVCDATPGWHPQTKKILVVGVKVRYTKSGDQLQNIPRSRDTAYATFDLATGKWSKWKFIEGVPLRETKFFTSSAGCVQWDVRDDGTILLPIYYTSPGSAVESTTVLHCEFDGETLRYLSHGSEHALNVVRGLCEASIMKFRDRYYMTIRNDLKGYVNVSDDGLNYTDIKEWTFDDGTELGSYNTQQHWLAHSDGLFLIYTRRGANNDHIFRNRAPLFMAQVSPEKLQVIRSSEKVLLPERGATFGNHGACAVSPNESWVTDAEGVFSDDARKRGANGSVFVARVKWSKPNRLVK